MDVDRAPSDIRLQIFYIFTKLKPEALNSRIQPLHTLRLALKDLGCPYIHEISFLDRSKRRAECYVNEADAQKFVEVMRKAKMLDENFNPLTAPPHKPEVTQDEAQKRLMQRRAYIVASTHFGPLKRAAADTLGAEMSGIVRERATAIRLSRDSESPKPVTNARKAHPLPPIYEWG